jgi:Fe2+ or Zn2+ uptake regulation protein
MGNPITPHLETLNAEDLHDLLGEYLYDRARKIVSSSGVQMARVSYDTLRGTLPRGQGKRGSYSMSARLPHPSISPLLSINLHCSCGQKPICEHVAALLFQWVSARSSFSDGKPEATMQQSSLPSAGGDALWRGLRGPSTSLSILLMQQKVGDVRRIARNLGIKSSGVEKESLIEEMVPLLCKAEYVQQKADTLSPIQRKLLDILMLRQTGLLPTHVEEAVAHLGEAMESARVFETMNVLNNAGLVQQENTMANMPGLPLWQVPLETLPHYRPVIPETQRIKPPPPLEEKHATSSDMPASQQIPLLSILRGLFITMQQRVLTRDPLPKASDIEFKLKGLYGWHNDPNEIEKLDKKQRQQRRGYYGYYGPEMYIDQETHLRMMSPTPLVAEKTLHQLSQETGGSSEIILFLLRLLENARLLDIGGQHVSLIKGASELLTLSATEQIRLLATAWAWLATWSELHELEGVYIRRHLFPTMGMRPDQIYAEMAAARRLVLRVLRTLEADRMYRVQDILTVLWRLHPRMLYEQRIQQSTHQKPARWWLTNASGRYLDPMVLQDWYTGEAAFVRQILRTSLSWLGIVVWQGGKDVSQETIRITPLGAYLLGISEQYEEPASSPTLQVYAETQKQQLTVQVTLKNADANVLAKLDTFMKFSRLEQGIMVYTCNARDMRDALSRGQAGDTILTFLHNHSAKPLTEDAVHMLEQWMENFGKATLYRDVALLELTDDVLLPELLRATRLKDAVLDQLSPRLLVVDPAQIEPLYNELVAKGYTPRRLPVDK